LPCEAKCPQREPLTWLAWTESAFPLRV
jgi:hypothetical protein